MLVRDAMNRNVITADPSASLREAARIMADNRVGSIVVEKGGKMTGIVTEHDVLLAVAESMDFDSLSIENAMTRYVVYISPEAKIEKAAEKMIEHQIKKLPVIDDDKVVGIITSSDIVAAEPALIKTMRLLIAKQKKE
jgi:CBS domain-containing protein